MSQETRSAEFYVLAIFFALFVLFLYGPFSAILILSFQGENVEFAAAFFLMHGSKLLADIDDAQDARDHQQNEDEQDDGVRGCRRILQ